MPTNTHDEAGDGKARSRPDEVQTTNDEDARINSLPTNKDLPLTNCMTTNTHEATGEGKSWGGEEEEGRRRSKRHRVRVFTNPVGQTSPTLYARANRHLCQEGSLKAYPRTVDFVLVNQLPAVGSFSYRDDSVESKSPNRLERKIVPPSSCSSEPMGVDLLNGLLPLSNREHRFEHKESALKVVVDNLEACVANGLEASIANELEACAGNDEEVAVAKSSPDCVPDDERSKTPDEDVPHDFQNFQCTAYDEIANGSDYIDPSSHYAYNSYKFSQIGRPPELSPSDPQ